MARMLQALKNLEARSAWPADRTGAAGSSAPGASVPGSSAAGAAHSSPLSPSESGAGGEGVFGDPQPQAPATHFSIPPAMLVEPPPPFSTPHFEPVLVAAPSALSLTAAAQPRRPAARSTATRSPCGIERAVRRTLSEPHRRQPLAELAARLRADAQKTGSRKWFFVGLGPASATHGTSLHLAALLAEEGANILLIDGDLARRQLSADLDSLADPGLTDLAREGHAAPVTLPTAFAGLSLLPVGTQRFADLDAAADLLAGALSHVATAYDLVLIDGGSAEAATALTLARLADATYVVVQLGTVEAATAQRQLRELRSAGARVLGSIATT